MICKTIEQAQKYARLVYPDLADVEFEIPRQGFEYFVLLTKNEAIRLPRREELLPAMAREVQTLQTLEGKLPNPIPVVSYYQPDTHIMRITRVPGVPLSRKMLATLPMETKINIGRQIGTFAASLHKVIPEGTQIAYAEQFSGHTSEKIRLMQSLNSDESIGKHLSMIEAQIVDDENSYKPTFCHGDLQLPNILFDSESGKIGVVDFSKAGRNIPLMDVAMAYYYPEPICESIQKAYQEISGITVDREHLRLVYEAHVISCRQPQDLLESYRLFSQPQPSV